MKDRFELLGELLSETRHRPCGCAKECCDLAEELDHPLAVCKELPPRVAPPAVEIVLVDRRKEGGLNLIEETNPHRVPECEVVAVRTGGPHDHIQRVQLADGSNQSAEEAITAIKTHEAHYVMRRPDLPLPLMLRAQQCPDCLEEVLWA